MSTRPKRSIARGPAARAGRRARSGRTGPAVDSRIQRAARRPRRSSSDRGQARRTRHAALPPWLHGSTLALLLGSLGGPPLARPRGSRRQRADDRIGGAAGRRASLIATCAAARGRGRAACAVVRASRRRRPSSRCVLTVHSDSPRRFAISPRPSPSPSRSSTCSWRGLRSGCRGGHRRRRERVGDGDREGRPDVAGDPVQRARRRLAADRRRAAEAVDQGLADVGVLGPRVAAQRELHRPPREHDDRDAAGRPRRTGPPSRTVSNTSAPTAIP